MLKKVLLAPVLSLLLFLLLLVSHMLAPLAWAEEMTVYRSASCGCCKGWINHIRDNGISVEDVVVEDVHYFKDKLGVPNNLRSCHTGVINGYVIEGHVPAAEIKQLLKEKQAVLGLAVPAMPVGTPGMEMGNRKDPFDVLSFDKTGSDGKANTQVYKEYRDY